MARRIPVLRRPPAFVGDGSILVVRLFYGLTNSDAFFAFSDTRVRFGQVGCVGRMRVPSPRGQPCVEPAIRPQVGCCFAPIKRRRYAEKSNRGAQTAQSRCNTQRHTRRP
ncbi:hypothetical protein C0Z19_13415 [Trinickia soli]|uniref:Uncharacterized protein n=1 Tax=Trinickia soli TaxID=380675 RepID=A0A2N7W4G7_9BURK|nr:hypothetical protein C0Z19_13415 [Trinickia soli]